MRLAPAYDSHDLADATRRDGFSAPRFRASSPTTHGAAASSAQGSARLSGGKVELAGDVEERRQQRARGDLSRVHELRDRQNLDRGRVLVRQIGARHRGVGRAEIDPDAVSRVVSHMVSYATSISAGATMVRPVVPSGGSSTRDARQPGWSSVPRNGGCPATLPTRCKAAGIDLLILPDRDRLAFPAGKDRLERHVAFEHAPAACVDVARGRADLRVGVRGEILEHEVDEPAFALQEGEHLDRTIVASRQRRAEPASRRERRAGARRAGGL